MQNFRTQINHNFYYFTTIFFFFLFSNAHTLMLFFSLNFRKGNNKNEIFARKQKQKLINFVRFICATIKHLCAIKK